MKQAGRNCLFGGTTATTVFRIYNIINRMFRESDAPTLNAHINTHTPDCINNARSYTYNNIISSSTLSFQSTQYSARLSAAAWIWTVVVREMISIYMYNIMDNTRNILYYYTNATIAARRYLSAAAAAAVVLHTHEISWLPVLRSVFFFFWNTGATQIYMSKRVISYLIYALHPWPVRCIEQSIPISHTY